MDTYKTRQKELIFDCLKNNNQHHMTAEEIYEELSSKGNKVGIATIYRNLAVLSNEGKIKKFDVSHTSCYQYIEDENNCKNHYHLKCVNCDKVYHIDSPELDSINKTIGESSGFMVDNQKIILYGKCKECL